MTGRSGDRWVIAALAVLACGAGACTQGVTPDAAAAPGVETRAEGTAPPLSAPPLSAPPLSDSPLATGVVPPPSSVAPTSTASSSTTTTTQPQALTIADQFAAEVAPLEVRAMDTPVTASTRDTIARLWLLVGRAPTAAELRTAVEAVVANGVAIDDLATLLLQSDENVIAPSDAPPERFVAGLYENVLGRRGEVAGIAGWVGALDHHRMSDGEVAVEFAESPEAVALTATTPRATMPAVAVAGVERTLSDSVLRLYLGLLGRFPTADELDLDAGRYVTGTPLATIADQLMRSPTYLARRPATDRFAIVSGLAEDVLGDRLSPADLREWLDPLDSRDTLGQIAVAFTESPTAVARTGTSTPRPLVVPPTLVDVADPSSGTDVLAVGDSVMLGASDALTRRLPGIAIDAKVGRQFREGLDIVGSMAEAGTIPGTVIFHLGTNGTLGAGGCDDLMTLLAGKRVVLVNVRVPRWWETPDNDVLAACAQRHGAQLVDWHTNATGLAPDGYHIGATGAEQYANLISAAVTPA